MENQTFILPLIMLTSAKGWYQSTDENEKWWDMKKNHKKDKEVGVKARHSKMKGTPFASKINYHYNILLKKVAGSLALGFLKFVVFLENLPLWSMCSRVSVGGPGQNPCIILEVRPDPWFPIARYSSLKGTLKCCGQWSLFPAHPFCKATLLILGTNTVLQEDGKKRGAGCMPMGGIPDLALPQSEGVKEQQPCRKTQESFREVGKTGKPARVGELYSVSCPPFQPKAHGARYLGENEDADLSSKVWIETSKQLIETVRAGRAVAWDGWDGKAGMSAQRWGGKRGQRSWVPANIERELRCWLWFCRWSPRFNQHVPSSHKGMKNICGLPGILLCRVWWMSLGRQPATHPAALSLPHLSRTGRENGAKELTGQVSRFKTLSNPVLFHTSLPL